eukprot:2329709-Lingulodinium_polyedra.AAC.1
MCGRAVPVSGHGLSHKREVPRCPAASGILHSGVPCRLMEKAGRSGVPLRDDMVPVPERG